MTATESRYPVRIVLAASLGYFVDLFDTFLMPALRGPSLHDLGVADYPSHLSADIGNKIFLCQLAGQMLGALFFWGPVADKVGRKKVLFWSILLYGIGNLATAFSTWFSHPFGTAFDHPLAAFTVLRIIAGVGLGGELGAGIALIAETMKPDDRTKGTMVVGFFGMLGVVAAGLIAKHTQPSLAVSNLGPQHWLTWRKDYILGGILAFGVGAMSARFFGIQESSLFEATKGAGRPSYWKILGSLVRPAKNLLKLVECIFVGAPTFFLVTLMASDADKTGVTLGMAVAPTVADALVWTYTSIAIGDIFCGLLAQSLQSRRRALTFFHGIALAGFGLLLFWPRHSPAGYYWCCAITGLGIGYWANMVTNASEQWDTNVRGTVTIFVPNFVRVLGVLLVLPFTALMNAHFRFIPTAATFAIACSALAIYSIWHLSEGFGRKLDKAGPA
jgi:MFS family permease